MILLHGHDKAVADWVAKRYGAFVRYPCVCLGALDSAGVLRGAFVVTMQSDTTAELHIFGKLSNDTVRGMFETVFQRMGVYRLEARVSKKNRTTKRAAPRFGFRFEGAAPDFYGPGQAALLYSMRPHECRWLRDHDGLTARRV